jgi:FkbM family methyltransferase
MLKNILLHTIYTEPLCKTQQNSRPTVIDCGANKGEFSSYVSKEFNAISYGFEPDPRLFSNLIEQDGISYYQLAVGSRDGTVRLNLGNENCSSIKYTESSSQEFVNVKIISLENFCNEMKIGPIDLLKVDIEGAELDLFENFSDEYLKTIRQITIEFHDHLNKGDIPRIKSIIKKMKENGFYVLNFSHFTYGDIMMLNRIHIDLNVGHKIAFIAHKYSVGIKRFINKIISRFKISN